MLARAIDSLLKKPGLREKIRRNAFEFVNLHFTKEIAMKNLIQLYKNMLYETEPKAT